MASPVRRTSESQPLLPPQGDIEAFAQDPRVLSEAIKLVAAQMAVNQSRDPAPPLENVTIQQEIPYNGGTYVGDIVDGEPHGRGTLIYPPGHKIKRYEGEWKNGKYHGKGALQYTNGDLFEGNWQYGQLHGWGIQMFSNGNKYEGNFIAGKSHGQGTMRWNNGNTYQGQWVNDEKHGKGFFKDANGSTYDGHYNKGYSHGQGTLTSSDDSYKYSGEWANNKHNGQGILVTDGSREEGIYRDGHLWSGTRKFIGSSATVHKDGVWQRSFCHRSCTIL